MLGNEAIRLERADTLQSRALRTHEARLGRANGSKPKTVATRKVTAVLEKLCGLESSPTQLSHCGAQLDAVLTDWPTRPLGVALYVILDARYEKVSLAGQLLDCAVLIALGITPAGKRTILGVSVALNEAETHWRTFLLGLQQRDLTGVQLLVSDHHAGLGAARGRLPVRPLAALPVSPPAKHPSLLPRLDERAAVANPIRSVFDSPNPRQ